MAEVDRMDYTGIEKLFNIDYSRNKDFVFSDEFCNRIKIIIRDCDFGGIDLDFPDLSLYIIQSKMVHLNEICKIFQNLENIINFEENEKKYDIFIKIPLWDAWASAIYADFSIEQIKGQIFIKNHEYRYDPIILILPLENGFKEHKSKSFFYSYDNIYIHEFIEWNFEEYPTNINGTKRAMSSSFLLIGSCNFN